MKTNAKHLLGLFALFISSTPAWADGGIPTFSMTCPFDSKRTVTAEYASLFSNTFKLLEDGREEEFSVTARELGIRNADTQPAVHTSFSGTLTRRAKKDLAIKADLIGPSAFEEFRSLNDYVLRESFELTGPITIGETTQTVICRAKRL